jgi:hypothetical protein
VTCLRFLLASGGHCVFVILAFGVGQLSPGSLLRLFCGLDGHPALTLLELAA